MEIHGGQAGRHENELMTIYILYMLYNWGSRAIGIGWAAAGTILLLSPSSPARQSEKGSPDPDPPQASPVTGARFWGICYNATPFYDI
jgi:hypothetical protein